MSIHISSLPALGVIHLFGRDAKTFLQGQLTCDMNVIVSGQTRLAAYCNRQGRMHAILRVFCLENGSDQQYLLRLDRRLIPHVIKTFKSFSIFSKVEMIEVSDKWLITGITIGEETPIEMLGKILCPSEIDTCIQESGFFISRVPGNKRRYEILYTRELKDLIRQALIQGVIVPEASWFSAEIASGIPSVTEKTIEMFTPHQVNLQCLNGISFTKGCYLGQEIVARMHHLGKLKQHGYYAAAKSPRCGEAAPAPFFKGGEIVLTKDSGKEGKMVLTEDSGKAAGHVINAVYFEETYHLLLSLQEAFCAMPLAIAGLGDLHLDIKRLPYHW